MHRPRPAGSRGDPGLRETAGGGTVVRGREARPGARGRPAAVAPGADALGDDPRRGPRARPDAGRRRSGPHPGLATPAPRRPPGTRTAGPIRAGPARRSRGVGPPALVPAISRKPDLRSD